MHQHPPKIPLLRSTSSAKAAHIEASRGRIVYDILESFARTAIFPARELDAHNRSPLGRWIHRREPSVGKRGQKPAAEFLVDGA
jgi:hypothetical protein